MKLLYPNSNSEINLLYLDESIANIAILTLMNTANLSKIIILGVNA